MLPSGEVAVDFIELTPEEYAALPSSPEPELPGFSLSTTATDESEPETDPNLRTMASEAAIHGFGIDTHKPE